MMRGRIMFVAGLAIGYVLGAKAGRERYEQLAHLGRKIRSNPTVQEATGLVQAQSARLVSTGREKVRGKLSDRFGDSRMAHSRIGQRLLGDPEGIGYDEPPPGPGGPGF